MNNKEHDESDLNLKELKESLINHICSENKAFFKSQQKDEPEISFDEKKNIALGILNKSHTNFLSRFGMSIKKEHLKFFELQNNHKSDDNEEKKIISEQIKHLSYCLDHEKILVKNRRYAAMLKLIQEKHYFSESEMKQRDPLLFEQLIGQYTGEKRFRSEEKTNTLVDVLFQAMDNERDSKIEREQRKKEEQDFLNNEDSQSNLQENESDGEDTDPQGRQHWGNFENSQSSNEPTPSTSKTRKRSAHLITAGERSILRDEFLSHMYENFLSGKDSEFFDYSEVDTNEAYDEVLENDQDCEDKYFDEDEPQDNNEELRDEKMENSDASEEDDLDIYMRHLEDNLKRQKQEMFHEEFDD